MARQRMIKPEFWTSEDVVSCTPYARLLFIGLWNFVDDKGVTKYSPLRLKMQIFPVDNVDVQELMQELIEKQMITIFEKNEKQWLWVKNFLKYQYIDKPVPSKNPLPPGYVPEDSRKTPRVKKSKSHKKPLPEYSGNTPGEVREDSGSTPAEKNRTEQNRKEQKTKENKQTEQKQISISAAVASFASALGKGNCSVSAAAPPRAIASELVKLGISLEKTQELVSRYPEEVIRNQIDWLPYRQFRKPVAGLIAAIEQNYEMPVIPQSEEQRAELEHLEKVKRCAKKYPDCAKLTMDMCAQCPNVLKKKAEMQAGHT